MFLNNCIVDKVYPKQTGTRTDGTPWQCADIAVRENVAVPHPDVVVIRFFGEMADTVEALRPGDHVNVVWESQNREYTDRNGVLRASADNRGYSIENAVQS